MINDENFVKLEGIIVSSPEEYETNGKKVMNFAVKNNRKTATGTDEQWYNCVAWNKTVEKFGDKMKMNAWVRITGHLQSNKMDLGEGKTFRYSKVCVDFIEFDD